jgi:hypothetical protein
MGLNVLEDGEQLFYCCVGIVVVLRNGTAFIVAVGGCFIKTVCADSCIEPHESQ